VLGGRGRSTFHRSVSLVAMLIWHMMVMSRRQGGWRGLRRWVWLE
jgi:hypothetical protein